MLLSPEHVGSKISAKIKIYILTRAELLITLCNETPCSRIYHPNFFESCFLTRKFVLSPMDFEFLSGMLLPQNMNGTLLKIKDKNLLALEAAHTSFAA